MSRDNPIPPAKLTQAGREATLQAYISAEAAVDQEGTLVLLRSHRGFSGARLPKRKQEQVKYFAEMTGLALRAVSEIKNVGAHIIRGHPFGLTEQDAKRIIETNGSELLPLDPAINRVVVQTLEALHQSTTAVTSRMLNEVAQKLIGLKGMSSTELNRTIEDAETASEETIGEWRKANAVQTSLMALGELTQQAREPFLAAFDEAYNEFVAQYNPLQDQILRAKITLGKQLAAERQAQKSKTGEVIVKDDDSQVGDNEFQVRAITSGASDIARNLGSKGEKEIKKQGKKPPKRSRSSQRSCRCVHRIG